MATIFVTGATGVLGRGAVARLLEAGHDVRALARNEERSAAIARLGAEPVVADLYDVDAMTDALTGADTVMHLATRIPPMTRGNRASAWAENTRLREVGTKVLVDAALAAGARRVVAESISYLYRDGGSDWLVESSPIESTPGLDPVVTLEREVERFTATADGGVGIALRFGSFYGADARSTDEYLRAARRGIAPALGSPDGYVSSIHTRDAATAVAASLGVPAGVYNVVDDTPLIRRVYVDAFAAAFGFGRLRMIPPIVARNVGGAAAKALLRSQRVSNAAFKSATGWTPEFPDAAGGWLAIAAIRKETTHA